MTSSITHCDSHCSAGSRRGIGAALSQFVIDNLGQDFIEQAPFDMEASLEESTAITPFFFVLFPGVDPTPTIEALGRKLGKTEANGQLLNISMGQGQDSLAAF